MNQIDLKGRRAVVTGAAQGIGLSITQRLLASGAEVCLWDQDASLLGQTSEMVANSMVHTKIVDVTDSDAVRVVAKETLADLGCIDILVNNAGQVFSKASTADISEEDWDRTFAVNLKGTFLCSQAAIRQMADGIGRIINISSISSCSGKGGPAYGPAKAAVNALTRDMAYELGPRGITVNGIAPGIIDTRIHQQVFRER